MSSITTKTGDAGISGLMYGARCHKTDQRFAALGALDELNAALGLAWVAATDGELKTSLAAVQGELIKLSMELATLPQDFQKGEGKILPEAAAEALYAQIASLEGRGAVMHGFERPGKNPLDGALHFARTIARRAEREVWILHEHSPLVRTMPAVYLNRLSDLLWMWAMYYQ